MIDQETLNVLKRCEVDGTKIKVIDDLYDNRPLYLKVNTVLERLRGKWNRKSQCHLFPYDVKDIFQAVLDSGALPPDNPESYYFTPDWVVDEILDILTPPNFKDWHILEPSAGTGHIARKIKNYVPEAALHLVEWLNLNVNLLKKQNFEVWHGDFMDYEPEILFDQIIMNPPFSLPDNKLAYIDHIYHAFELLKSDRKMVAIIPMGWTYRSDKKNVGFRNFIWKYLDMAWELEAGTFKEAGTNVKTIVVVLDKSDWKLEPKEGFPSWNSWSTSLYLHNDQKTFEKLYGNEENEGAIVNKGKFNVFLEWLVNELNIKHYEGIMLSEADKEALWNFVNEKE